MVLLHLFLTILECWQQRPYPYWVMDVVGERLFVPEKAELLYEILVVH